MLFSREVQIKRKVKVCIVGGGPSGCAAALTAARQGASVYLAEAHTCLGGLGTAGGVPLFMTFSDGENFVADGIGREIMERMNIEDTASKMVNSINPEILKRLYEKMLLEAGVDFTFMTEFIGAETNNSNVKCAVFNTKSGIFAVEADVFIDCSGDGDLCARAGAEFACGDENGNVMPATLCSAWSGINWEKFRASGANPRQILFKAFEDNIFRNNDPHHTGINQTAKHLGGGNMGHLFDLNPLDEKSLTDALIEGRKQAPEFEQYYKEYIPGYENVELTTTASLLGIRESRRITGDYILKLDDYKSRAVFDDEIGRYSYPIDIHPASTAKKDQQKFEELIRGLRYKCGESYGIPYRILTVKGFDNLLNAGRSVSTDRYMQGSIRVMPGCFITGQAVGIAAALACENGNNIRNFNVNKLQSMLKKVGAFLPNC
jgi:FAD-dependent oxidoreductase family protein